MLQRKMFSSFHFLVKHVAKTRGELLNGIALDPFLALVHNVQHGGGVASLLVEPDVDAEQEDWTSHGNFYLTLRVCNSRFLS